MGKRKFTEAKDPFATLPDEWKDMIMQSTPEAIDTEVARLAKGEQENQSAKEQDQDLTEKKEAVKYASEGYREGTKGYKLRMKFIMQTLVGRGKA